MQHLAGKSETRRLEFDSPLSCQHLDELLRRFGKDPEALRFVVPGRESSAKFCDAEPFRPLSAELYQLAERNRGLRLVETAEVSASCEVFYLAF